MSVLQEISKYQIPAVKNDDTKFTWHGTVLTTLTDFSVTIFKLSNDILSRTKEINYIDHAIPHPKHSVTAQLIPGSFAPSLKDNLNYTQLLVDPIFWPHNPKIEAESTRIVSYEWAPTKLTYNNEYILTTLTSSGNVELFTYKQNKWQSKYNVTERYLKIKPNTSNHPKTTAQLKEIMDVYVTSVICWQPNVINNHCFFVTVQGNSDLLFWLITSDNLTISMELNCTHKIKSGSILTANWIPLTNDTFLIVCSNLNGQVYSLKFSIENQNILLQDTSFLWEDHDKMIARNVIYLTRHDYIILIYSKNRHLVMQKINKNADLKTQFLSNINDFKITSIVANGDSFYVSACNCEIYSINITNYNDLAVNITPIKLPKAINSSTYELQSMSICNNYTFLGLGLLESKLCLRKNKVTLDVIILNNKLPETIISEFIHNPYMKLTNMWETIEYLRHRTIKSKSMPDIDFNELYTQAKQNIYKLKIYYIFLTWYQYLTATFIPESNIMPEMSLDKVKDRILLLHAISILHSNIKKYPDVSEFENKVLNGCKRYLLHFCMKYNDSIDNYIENKAMSNIIDNDVHYCESCDKEIMSFSCKDNHFNMLCSLTFTFIDGDEYLVCKYCKMVARKELITSNPLCVFCDLLLSKS